MITIFKFAILLAIAFTPANGTHLNTTFIVYCPCMGRLGNQIEQFLGMLSFAKKLKRTLVLPAWNIMNHTANFIPFENLYDIPTLLTYHRVISIEKFMIRIAEIHWPPILCYQPRPGPKDHDCNAKSGSPFKDFWNQYDVEFLDSIFYGPLTVENSKSDWDKMFPPSLFSVLAFIGPPSAFPAKPRDWSLQRYLQWSYDINQKNDQYLETYLIRPIIAVHLRNGIDFNEACSLIGKGLHSLFASAQCHGDRNEKSPFKVNSNMCFPSKESVLETILYAVHLINASSIYVATDHDPMLTDLRKLTIKTSVQRIVWHPYKKPQDDLAILGRADLAILNCVSTFSAAAKRERDYNKLPTMFFGIDLVDQRGLECLCRNTCQQYGVPCKQQSLYISP